MALPVEKNGYTFKDMLGWDVDDVQAEIIGGVVCVFNTPSPKHQEISVELLRQLATYLRGKRCKVYHAPFSVRLFEKEGDKLEDIDTVVQPDITVICDQSKIDGHGCKGAPDMVIEILSPSTRRHDKFIKLDLYRRSGVKEYWLVDPDVAEVQVLVLVDSNYSLQQVGFPGDKIKVNILEDCVIDPADVFPE